MLRSLRPSRARPSRARRRLGAGLASVLLAAASVVLVAGPASAHDQLLSTDPADGATVAALPAKVTMTFNDVVLDTDGGTQVRVTDAAGRSLADGPVQIQDNVVTQPLHGTASGTVCVLWRVVSADGHPVSSEFAFTVGTATPGATPGGCAKAAEAASGTGAASGPSPAPWIVLGAVVIAAIAGGGYLVLSRNRRSAAAGAPGASGDDPDEGPGEGPSGPSAGDPGDDADR